MTATRWELECNHWSVQLGLCNLNDKRGSTYALYQVAPSVVPKLVGKTGIPTFWQLECRKEVKQSFPLASYQAVQSLPAVASSMEIAEVYYANVYDTGGFCLGCFKLADSFMEELNGRYRRTPAQVHGSAHTTSGGGAGYLTSPTATFTSLWPTPEPKPIENAGIRAGEIVGHRCWRVIDGYLHSAYMREYRWPPRHPLRAVNMTDYANGIYALFDVKETWRAAVEYMHDAGWFIQDRNTPFVTGTCYLWGDVVEHEKGWRASFAMVKSIDAVVTGDVDLEALRERYEA